MATPKPPLVSLTLTGDSAGGVFGKISFVHAVMGHEHSIFKLSIRYPLDVNDEIGFVLLILR